MPRPHPLALLFLLLGLPVCLSNALLMPPGEVPDEIAHIIRADGLRHGVLVGKRRLLPGDSVPTAGVYADMQLVAAWSGPPGLLADRTVTRAHLERQRATPWGANTAFVASPNTAAYMPLLYLPTATVLTVAQGAGLRPYAAILAARAVNAALYLAAGVVALTLARRGRGLLFLGLLLPMSLSMAASCNQDGLLIAMSAMGAALLTRLSAGAFSPGTFWTAAALLAVVLAAKPLYVPLAGLLLLVAPSWRIALHGMSLAVVPAVAWFAVAQSRAGVPLRRLPAQSLGPLWSGDPGAVFSATDPGSQLRVLLDAPWRVIALPALTLWEEVGLKLWEMVGVLGQLDLLLPYEFYLLACAGLAAVLVGDALAAPGRHSGLSLWGGVLGFGYLAASLLAVYIGQYLSWTPVGATRVDGVQGRYAIPLLLFAAVTLPQIKVNGGPALRSALRLPAVLTAVAGAAVVPVTTVFTYYLR